MLEVLQAPLLVELHQARTLLLVVVFHHCFVLVLLLHALLLNQPLADKLQHRSVEVLVGEGFPAESLVDFVELQEDLFVLFVKEPPRHKMLQRLLNLSELDVDIRYGLLVVIKVGLLAQQIVLPFLPHNRRHLAHMVDV